MPTVFWAQCWTFFHFFFSSFHNSSARRSLCCSSVTKSLPTLSNPMDCSTPGFPVLHYLPEFAQIHVHWVGCYLSISSSVIPFSSWLQSFPASGSFPKSRLFVSGGQSIGASASVIPVNSQGWFPLGLTGLISLQSQGLFTVWKPQFFSVQPSLWSNDHVWTWLLEKRIITLTI